MHLSNEPSIIVLLASPKQTPNTSPKLAAEIHQRQTVALHLCRMQRESTTNEWLSIPLMETSGTTMMDDDIFENVFHPYAISLLEKCDAVVRTGGDSTGADAMVAMGKLKGKKIFYNLNEVISNP